MDEEYKLRLADFRWFREYQKYIERTQPGEDRMKGTRILVPYNLIVPSATFSFILLSIYPGLESLLS